MPDGSWTSCITSRAIDNDELSMTEDAVKVTDFSFGIKSRLKQEVENAPYFTKNDLIYSHKGS